MKESQILLIAVFLVFVALLSYRVTYAFFSGSAISVDNVFSTSSEFPQTPPEATATPTITPTETASPTAIPIIDLQINEFMANPASPSAEWVEIFNNGNVAINLTGWTIIDNNGISDDLVLSGIINPGQHLTFDHIAGWLNNVAPGDIVSLRNTLGATVSAHTYTSATLGTTIGRSIDGTGAFKVCTTTTKGTSNNGNC